MAHELAHQWFGDLVTTAWWDDIWLNEGFASWMANKIVNQYRPEWKMNIDELDAYQGAMDTDALVSSRKVRQEILSDDDIANAFDGITYSKGSSLLNMFESYMGREKFREGVQAYLKKYSWGNATSADFLASIGGGDPAIAKAFSTFLDQPGVPLVTAHLSCGGGSAELQLAQQRFLPRGSSGSADQLWDIPVCVRYPTGNNNKDGRQCTLVTAKTATLHLDQAQGCPAWTYDNADQAGYYRVRYDGDMLASILKDEKALALPERVGLVGDIAGGTDLVVVLAVFLWITSPWSRATSWYSETRSFTMRPGMGATMSCGPLAGSPAPSLFQRRGSRISTRKCRRPTATT